MEGETSTVSTSAAIGLLQDVFTRRKRCETNCQYIAARRHSHYEGIPINYLIPLAYHTTPGILDTLKDTATAIQTISNQYNKSDLFSDWQRYCRALKSDLRATATFGMVILFPPTYTDLLQRVRYFSRHKIFQVQSSEMIGTPCAIASYFRYVNSLAPPASTGRAVLGNASVEPTLRKHNLLIRRMHRTRYLRHKAPVMWRS